MYCSITFPTRGTAKFLQLHENEVNVCNNLAHAVSRTGGLTTCGFTSNVVSALDGSRSYCHMPPSPLLATGGTKLDHIIEHITLGVTYP